MKRSPTARSLPVLLLSGLLAGVFGVPAFAQNNNSGADHGPPMTIQQMAQQRLSSMQERLNITPNERSAWDQFAQVSMQNATQADQTYRQRAESVPNMNAAQNLRSFANIQRQQARDMERLSSAFDALYSQLSPQQRQTADQMFRDYAQRAAEQRQAPRR